MKYVIVADDTTITSPWQFFIILVNVAMKSA